MSGHSATRGLPGRRNGSKTSSRSTLQQASVALVAFSMGSVFAFLILRPSTPPPPAEHEAFSLAARSQLMLGQITSLQRQLSIRDAELVQLRSLPTELEKIPNPADITLEARLAVKPEDGLIQASDGCSFRGPVPGFLPECSLGCKTFDHLPSALEACSKEPSCGGVVHVKALFELRGHSNVEPSPEAETSYVRLCPRLSIVSLPQEPPPPQKQQELNVDRSQGDWTVGNVEHIASKVYVHERDPLPAFYDPSHDGFTNIDDIGSFVDGLPTILLKVASYRDELCHITIADAFEKATHPERIFVGVVEQNAAGDVPCLQVDSVSECPPSHVSSRRNLLGQQGGVNDKAFPTLCRWGNHVRLYKQHAMDATGPTFARHVGDRLYRGEYFVLQTDAHMTFVKGWDVDVVSQFDAADNDMAVLSTYPTEVVGSIDKFGHSTHKTTPVMCATEFTGEGLLRHGSAIEIYPMFGPSPVLEPFWAAGFSFARGHFTLRVPYDCCTPMLFQGEEIDIGIRAWTQGYDLYTPHNSVAFHPYNRAKKPPMFWENNAKHKGESMKSARRVQALIEMGKPPSNTFDGSHREAYTVGTKRHADDFYALFGVNREIKSITKDLCSWSTSGQMHKQLTAYMRADKKGIDYERAIKELGLEIGPKKQAKRSSRRG